MKTELFLFDMGEVLVLDGVNLPEIAAHLKVGKDELERDYDKYDYPMMEGWMDTADYMRHLESEFGVKIEGNLFRQIYNPRTNLQILPILGKIREKGGRLAVGSNTFLPHVERISALPENPLGTFDALYFSHEMHLSKPSLSFFRYILGKEHVSPESVLFVDDRAENTRAAERLGIRTFLYSVEKNGELEETVSRLLENSRQENPA